MNVYFDWIYNYFFQNSHVGYWWGDCTWSVQQANAKANHGYITPGTSPVFE